jgi:hypothetical protein
MPVAQIQANMANQMPPAVKQFKVSILPLFLYSVLGVFIGLVPGFVLIAIHYGHPVLQRFLLISRLAAPLMLVVCVVATLLLYLVAIPSGFSADGIYGSSPLGFRRFIRWTEIARVRKLTILNLQFLRLNSGVDGRETVLPVFQARKREFREEIIKFAPPDSPILKFMG